MTFKIARKNRLLSVSHGWDGIMVHVRNDAMETSIILSEDEAEKLIEELDSMLDARSKAKGVQAA